MPAGEGNDTMAIYEFNDILDRAVDGVTELVLESGDRAWAPGSNKHRLAGPGTARYVIAPEGVTVEVGPGVTVV